MTDASPTHDHGTADTEGPFAALAPAVRTIVFDALAPQDRSLPVALCTIAGTVGSVVNSTSTSNSNSSNRRAVELLDPVTNAVAFLEGYVRIRSGLLESDRYADADRRDAAVLASDYLHAAAYAPIATVPDQRALKLYRVLTDGSSSLAAQFVQSVSAADGTAPGTPPSPRPHPNVTLAGTAATLGATAVGAPDGVRTAMTTYARSLSAALLARTGSESETGTGNGSGSERGHGTAESSPADPRTTAVRVLSGRAATETGAGTGTRAATETESTADDDTATNTSSIEQIEHHLERARGALETLEELTVSAAACETHDADRSPIDRLERATRIPFHHEQ